MGEISDALRRAGGAKPKPPPREPSDYVAPRRRASDPPEAPPERRRAGPAPSAASAATMRAPQPARQRKVLQKEGGDPRTSAARITLADPLGHATQQYRRLAFRIRDLADGRHARSIVVTSARPLDGKTTTACNLAIQLARLDKALSVILVDLDLRRAGIAASFAVTPEVPVDAVLRGDRPLDDAILDTDVPGLALLALSTPAPDAESLLSLPSLERMIDELDRRFDFVVIDTPPVLATSDAQMILRHADAGLFVARTGASPVKAVRRALDHIQLRKMLGSVLNASRGQNGLADYPYYGYGRSAEAEAAADDAPPASGDASTNREDASMSPDETPPAATSAPDGTPLASGPAAAPVSGEPSLDDEVQDER